MSTQVAELHQSIQLLTKSERAELACHLLSTLDGEEEIGAEKSWQTEIQKRVADYRAGKASCISEDELFERLSGRE